MDVAHSFRLLLKSYMTPKKALNKGNEPTFIEKPTEGTIWVAKTYPYWQNTVLTTMKNMYLVSNYYKVHLRNKQTSILRLRCFIINYFTGKWQ